MSEWPPGATIELRPNGRGGFRVSVYAEQTPKLTTEEERLGIRRRPLTASERTLSLADLEKVFNPGRATARAEPARRLPIERMPMSRDIDPPSTATTEGAALNDLSREARTDERIVPMILANYAVMCRDLPPGNEADAFEASAGYKLHSTELLPPRAAGTPHRIAYIFERIRRVEVRTKTGEES